MKKVLAVAATIPQMTVLGIAGPGDPLANPERTFATFRMLSEQAPDIKLCVSTNGLALPDHVDELAKHNIEHVTITINCVDPDVGAQIYPWIFWKNKRIRGREGAAILIEQQQKGLEMLVAKGILVKVNSVMIPGVNDQHLAEVSKIVKAKGAFLHNVMPLISEAEHGTFYGLTGQRGPTHDELQALQDACAGDMNMMRHCRQCRADAVGLLGEDRGAEFTMDKIEEMDINYPEAMKMRAEVHAAINEELESKRLAKEAKVQLVSIQGIQKKEVTRPVLMAVATKGGGVINEHFGHAREFLIYEASSAGVRFIGHRKTTLTAKAAIPAATAKARWTRHSGCWPVAKPCCAPRSATNPGDRWKPPASSPTASMRWKPSRMPCSRCTRRCAWRASWKQNWRAAKSGLSLETTHEPAKARMPENTESHSSI